MTHSALTTVNNISMKGLCENIALQVHNELNALQAFDQTFDPDKQLSRQLLKKLYQVIINGDQARLAAYHRLCKITEALGELEHSGDWDTRMEITFIDGSPSQQSEIGHGFNMTWYDNDTIEIAQFDSESELHSDNWTQIKIANIATISVWAE